MAKRKPPRSQADETSHVTETDATPARPKTRRPRAVSAPEDTIGAYPGVERSEDDGAITRAVTGDQSSSMSMGSEPSDDDIRARAYLRFLERGGNHGQDFEDWLAAERELKQAKSTV